MNSKRAKYTQGTKRTSTPEKQKMRKELLKHFLPLILAVASWAIVMFVLHLPAIHDAVIKFFVKFTIDSVVLLGKLTFIPIYSPSYPLIVVSDYPMVVIMECTAYNFYIFVIFLSLFSPVGWKQRFLTMAIFIPSVFIINSLRFITMGYIGKYYPEQFDNIHDYLWNILFGFLVFIIWVWRYHKYLPKFDQTENQSLNQESTE